MSEPPVEPQHSPNCNSVRYANIGEECDCGVSGKCRGTCNAYATRCGALFCTYEEMADHERKCQVAPVAASPVPQEELPQKDSQDGWRAIPGSGVAASGPGPGGEP